MHVKPGLDRRRLGVVAAAVFVVALALRLVTVLRGGGLYGAVGYDGSVYYSAAAGLAHGLLPYRDFLLLHPPGVLLALLPFAALGRLIGDPDAFALARAAWIALGAANAALVVVVLRRLGRGPALAGGLFYAVFVPALYSEHSTSLEALGSTSLLLAVVLITRSGSPRTATGRAFLVAGLFLGASSGTKIWATAIVLALIGWSLATAGVRRALLLLIGAVGGAVVICLPFFAAAPGTMWRMVVADQLGRRRVPGGLATRVIDIAGLSQLHTRPSTTLLLFGVCVVVGAALAWLAVRDPLGRLALVLLSVTVGLLLATPSWSPHYAGLAGPPAALLFGVAYAGLVDRLPRYRRAYAAVAGVGLLGYATVTLATLIFGNPFPGAHLGRIVATSPGCVTTDDPTVLIESGALARNLEAGCPFVADLGGYSYDLQPGADLRASRAVNAQWQRYAQDYLGSGSTTVIARFRVASGYSKTTKKLIAGWPVIGTAGGYAVQRPAPRTVAPPR